MSPLYSSIKTGLSDAITPIAVPPLFLLVLIASNTVYPSMLILPFVLKWVVNILITLSLFPPPPLAFTVSFCHFIFIFTESIVYCP